MIFIKIWKLKEYDCWNCYGIEDFSINRNDLSETNNCASYSWSTRDNFKEWFIYNLFSSYSYIKILIVIDELEKLKLNIPQYKSEKNIWEWFMVYCRESLKRYWEDAYIYQDCFSSSEWKHLNEFTKDNLEKILT